MATDDRLIRVNMTDQTVEIVEFPERWKLLGGRGLLVKILLEECDPLCDPLGPDNVFVIAPGVLTGSAAPTSGRISFGAKSPLTRGIKEANAGGNPSQDLMKLGYRGVVITGQPADPSVRFALDVTKQGAQLKSVPECKGVWNYALIEQLAESYSATASFISIGPAGEQRLKGASVACTDQEQNRHPARHAARGGLGAVMGSKGLKYVSVDAEKARVRRPARSKEFAALCKSMAKNYVDGPQMMKYGTSTNVPMAQALHSFPYKNRIEGQSPDFESLDGMNIVKGFESRGGGMHNCMTGCVVKCSNIVHDAEGNYKTSALEFETITLLGANCAIKSWEDVADLDRLCDDVGLDTIETGAAIAIYMESGGLEWGDAEGAKQILHQIAEGTELGRAIGDGADSIGRREGVARIPTVRGQAIPAWDPRPLKATGVTYVTSAQGADHTAGLVVNPGLDPQDMPRISQDNQIINALIDSSGFCMFLSSCPDDIRAFYSAFYDIDVTREMIYEMGWECIADEWDFNRRAGIDLEADCMPECMKTDGVGPQKVVFDVDHATVLETYKCFGPREEFFKSRGVA